MTRDLEIWAVAHLTKGQRRRVARSAFRWVSLYPGWNGAGTAVAGPRGYVRAIVARETRFGRRRRRCYP